MTELATRTGGGRGYAQALPWPVAAMQAIASSILVALAIQGSIARAQDAGELPELAVDTAEWKCKYCEFEEGWYSDFTLGLTNVSDDSFKFGEYTGLVNAGNYLIGDASARYRGEDAAFLDLSVIDIGLDTRSLAIEGGTQGRYELFLTYDELPHYISDSAVTPYRGNGGDTLSLPAGWVNSSNTAGMTALDANLREVELKTERKRLGAGITVASESPWSYDVELRHEDKEGDKLNGGSFLFSSAQLVEPVDYVTDEIDVAVSYTGKRLQGKLAYSASTFSNANESLTWENAYTPIVAGAVEGQLALPPDNQAQQLALSLGYRINDRNHVSGDIAVGRMTQNEKFLAATQNAALAVPSLPADSANAEVETTNARLGFISMPTDRLRLSAKFSYDDRDNKTPQLMYDWVSTDTVLAPARSNLPYSYTRSALGLQADYEVARGTRLELGFDFDERERTFQEVDKTREDTLWSKLRVRGIDTLFFEFRIATGSRDASASEVVSAIDPPENPLMAKYNMADRDRDAFGVFASFLPHPDYSIGFSFDSTVDDYSHSELGLSDSRDNSVNLDVSAILTETTSVNAFVGRQEIKSSQAGSQSFGSADWVAGTEDTFDNFGIGVTYVVIEDTLDIGLDYMRSRSTGEIEIDNAGAASAFPSLRTDLESIKLYLNYRFDENLTLMAAYWHETYDSSDWALDGADPDTVSNLLSFGLQSPDYTVDVIKLAMRYQF